MAAIETKEQLEKVRVGLQKIQAARKVVEKANSALRDASTALGNVLGVATVDPLKLEEEARRLAGDAFIAGIHERDE